MIAKRHWHRNLAGIVAALGLPASSCRHRQRFVEPADSPQHLGVIDQVFGNDMDGAARALDFTASGQHLRGKNGAPLLLELGGPDDEIGNVGFIFKSDEHDAFGRPRHLADQHEA